MKNSQLIILPILLTLLLSGVFVLAYPDQALGQMTIPTRTPVPPDPDPTDDDGGGGGGGDDGDNQPAPTNTPQPVGTPIPPTISVQPTNTATSTLLESPTPAATITGIAPTETSTVEASPTFGTDFDTKIDEIAPGSTPVEFPILATAYPTAEPCGEPPTFTTLTTANIYKGPGSDYPVHETLAADEVRPIVGRAAYATWWLIQLDGKYQQAWISDKAGTVQGFTGNVPIIEAPAINGTLPTPGNKEWDPTPAPICTPTPTPTSDAAVVSGSIIDYDQSSASEKVNTSSDINAAAEQRSEIAEAAEPLELEVPSTTPTPNLLPIAGLVLVIAAIFVALFLRRSPGGGDASS